MTKLTTHALDAYSGKPAEGMKVDVYFIGDRKEKRVGEKIGIFFFKMISPLFLGSLKKMKPVQSEKVAQAMINVSNGDFEKTIFESNEIVEVANN